VSDSFDRAILHFQAAAQLLQLRRGKPADPQSVTNKAILPFHRTAAESVLWHLSALSPFHSDLDSLAQTVSWTDLEDYFVSPSFPSKPPYVDFPTIGHFTSLHLLAFETVRLSRHVPLNAAHALQASKYQAELAQIISTSFAHSPPSSPSSFCHTASNASSQENEITMPLSATGSEEEEELHNFGARLWILALLINLAKIQQPSLTHACSPDIRLWVSEALALLSSPTASSLIKAPFGEYICWPLTIFACAVRVEEDVQLLRGALRMMWPRSHCGYIQRTERVIEGIWNRTNGKRWKADCCGSGGERDCDCEADGLDLLVQKGGIGEGILGI
jgi:hypothetical protein